jgi:hypothetical protein
LPHLVPPARCSFHDRGMRRRLAPMLDGGAALGTSAPPERCLLVAAMRRRRRTGNLKANQLR